LDKTGTVNKRCIWDPSLQESINCRSAIRLEKTWCRHQSRGGSASHGDTGIGISSRCAQRRNNLLGKCIFRFEIPGRKVPMTWNYQEHWRRH
jgi:hypothetical protein